MLRITLQAPFPRLVTLRLGAEIMVPMQFGSITPEITADFSHRHEALPSQPRIWGPLEYGTENDSMLVPNEVAVHYFGDWRAGSDMEAVAAKRIPSLNDERERVANKWGGYFLSGKHGLYTTVRIAVPDVPDVLITNVNANGASVGDWKFEPLKFWDFKGLLDVNAEAEMAEITSRRTGAPVLDLSKLSPEQLRELAKLVGKEARSAASAT